jgi:hypothetical protein
MGDRCYMELNCLRKDAAAFEELGFCLSGSDEDAQRPVVSMVCEEANYAHYGDMPKDIPYRGKHGAGGCYGPKHYACDGANYDEVEVGHEGGCVVTVDNDGNATPASLAAVKAFCELDKKVNAMLVEAGKAVSS